MAKRKLAEVKRQKDKLLENVPSGIRQVVKFGIVGIINFIITFISFKILFHGLQLGLVFSNFSSYFFGFLNSFYMNKNWTFKSKGNITNEALLFILVFAVAYAAQLGFLLLITGKLGVSADVEFLFSMVVYTMVGFLLNKFITFKNRT